MIKSQEDTISVESRGDLLSVNISCPIQFDIKDTQNNRKLLYVLLRLFKKENGQNIATFQKISNLFGLKSRQDSNNFYREFQEIEEDFLYYLQRKKKLGEAFPLIEAQLLKNPLLTMSEHFKMFTQKHPEIQISYLSFTKYASEIDAVKLKKRFEQLLTKKVVKPDAERFLKEIIEDESTSKDNRKTIVQTFPKLQEDDKKVKKEISFLKNTSRFSINFLVLFLIGSSLSYNTLSILMGVSKATIHNLFYGISFLKRLLRNSIKWWSGVISTDEKWLKINNKWYYVLSIIDDKTGFLLDYMVVSDLKKDTWKLFFDRFYRHYGKPNLIISDGSEAIAGAIKQVFPKTNHQLCKFHKLKNLMDRIYKYSSTKKERKRWEKLANGIFRNKTSFGQKRAAKKLIEISSPEVASYIEKSILNKWKHLTKGYTSNSAERWNRKIEKVTQGR